MDKCAIEGWILILLFNPEPEVVFPCGSESTTSTGISLAAREAPRLIAVVVFPTPPFWFVIAMIFATSEILAEFHVEHPRIKRLLPTWNVSNFSPHGTLMVLNFSQQSAIRSDAKASHDIRVERPGKSTQSNSASCNPQLARPSRRLDSVIPWRASRKKAAFR